MNDRSGWWAFHHGNGASMWHLEDGAADFVLTSPPYYPPELEPVLRQPLLEQTDVDEVEQQVTTLALSLQPVFHEIARVLKAVGVLVLQTRDIRYGGFLIGPMDVHRRLAESAGFRLVTEIGWESTPSSIPRARAITAMWKRGRFVTAETERFLVFSRTPLVELQEREVSIPPEYADALWRLPAQGSRSSHPHESPISVVRRLVEEYTDAGELVVDPFCGHGNVVLTAVDLGRHGVGYDIDADCIAAAEAKLQRTTAAEDGDGH